MSSYQPLNLRKELHEINNPYNFLEFTEKLIPEGELNGRFVMVGYEGAVSLDEITAQLIQLNLQLHAEGKALVAPKEILANLVVKYPNEGDVSGLYDVFKKAFPHEKLSKEDVILIINKNRIDEALREYKKIELAMDKFEKDKALLNRLVKKSNHLNELINEYNLGNGIILDEILQLHKEIRQAKETRAKPYILGLKGIYETLRELTKNSKEQPLIAKYKVLFDDASLNWVADLQENLTSALDKVETNKIDQKKYRDFVSELGAMYAEYNKLIGQLGSLDSKKSRKTRKDQINNALVKIKSNLYILFNGFKQFIQKNQALLAQLKRTDSAYARVIDLLGGEETGKNRFCDAREMDYEQYEKIHETLKRIDTLATSEHMPSLTFYCTFPSRSVWSAATSRTHSKRCAKEEIL